MPLHLCFVNASGFVQMLGVFPLLFASPLVHRVLLGHRDLKVFL